ncbi:MAG: glycosyltransferase [Thermoplasmatales archaeon]
MHQAKTASVKINWIRKVYDCAGFSGFIVMSSESLINRSSDPLEIVQLCHGKLSPSFSSAYSLRCNDITAGLRRHMFSLHGPALAGVFTPELSQYRANFLVISSFIHGNRSFEIFLSQRRYMPRKYVKNVNENVKRAKSVMLEGPWQFDIVRKYVGNKPLIYDAHNFESQLRAGNRYYDYVRKLEEEVCRSVDLVIAVTDKDRTGILEQYDISKDKIILITIVPNIREVAWNGLNSRSLIFIGSLYEGNISAYREIEKLALELKEFTFYIIGSICNLPTRKRISNVKCLGIVSEEEKDRLLASSMLALNPILLGSGRNVKMVDYLGHGVPSISTPLGVRGFEKYDISKASKVTDTQNFASSIRLLVQDPDLLLKMSAAGKEIYSKIKLENSTSFREIHERLV